MTRIRKGRKRKVVWFLTIFMVLLVGLVAFFKMPYSKTRSQFEADVQRHLAQSALVPSVFTQQDIASLPEPVQRHLSQAGYIGTTKMSSMTAFMKAVPLKQGADKPELIVDYTLRSFAYQPVRLAYIQAAMFGVPFEGYDSIQGGTGFMKGVIGKLFTLFNQTGAEMDKGQLITYLAECFLIPSSVLSEFIVWEPIDEAHVKATITYNGISGSGVFTFSDDGLVQSFYSDERSRVGMDGSVDTPGWTALYLDYHDVNGIYMPKRVQVIWHEEQDDLVYFDADDIKITFH